MLLIDEWSTMFSDCRCYPGVPELAMLRLRIEIESWLVRRPETAFESEETRPMQPALKLDWGPGRSAPDPYSISALADHVQGFLQHLVGSRDDAGAGRIGLLGNDQLGEFVRNIGIGRLKRPTDDAGTGQVENRFA